MKTTFIRLGLLGALLGLGAGCKVAATKAPLDAPARRALLKNLSERVIAPTYADFAKAMADLEDATAGYATSLRADDRTRAQAAFAKAMLVWERAEVFQVGPAARVSGQTPGGKGLRNEIYSWPNLNSCGISASLIDKSYEDDVAFEAKLFADARALGALQVLLYDEGTDAHCATAVVVPAEWEALVGSGELPAHRALYAKTVARIVHRKADELVTAWAAFAPELANAGKGGKVFATTQDALNAVTDGLFYVDNYLKDVKLGNPGAIAGDCTVACADRTELKSSKLSKAAVIANLTAFGDMFSGLPPDAATPGVLWGLSDLLRSVSAESLAKDIADLTAASIAEVQLIAPSLEEASEGDLAQIQKAYMKVQELTTRLKTDFAAKLSLSLPASTASDSD